MRKYIIFTLLTALTTVGKSYAQNEVVFIVDGIAYTSLEGDMNEVKVVRVTDGYSGNVVIPASVEYSNRIWQVTKVVDGAFASCPRLTSVSIPASVKEVGTGLFEGDTHLAAIEWNADVPLTHTLLGTQRNPNLLYYVKSKELASNFSNVITGSDESGWVAEQILLSDNNDVTHDFYAPKAFTAQHISYTHAFLQTTQRHSCQGWETIALPFDVDKILNGKGEELTPFQTFNEGKEFDEWKSRPFWLYEYDDDELKPASSIKANTPYAISMPNNPYYIPEFNIAGNVTFSATNVEVKASDNINAKIGSRHTFYPAFQARDVEEGNYVVNVGETYLGQPEGSVCVRYWRDVRPFEGYFTNNDGSVKEDWFDLFDSTTEIEEVKNEEWADAVYDLAGRRIQKPRCSGIYIVNGRKRVVK